jgi:serine/threonine-protein kinase PknK
VQALGLRSVLCVPMLSRDRLVGLIYLDAPSEAGRFGPREEELTAALAALISQPLYNARRFETQTRLVEAQRHQRPGSTRPWIGQSPAFRALEELIQRVASGTHPVLIQGESGTGKELVAREVHEHSQRSGGPFVAENMGAIHANLLEAEVFGHAKGAFTGADTARPGLFQLASGGTLLLDEVGEMSASLQTKLLRVLQEGEVRPVGSSSSIKVDVRVIAATNRDLQAMVREGSFREDLYYRLNVIRIRVPPLRERAGDLPLLLAHFAARAAADLGRPAPELTPELLDRLARHPWQGNVRELEGFATRLVLEGPTAEPDRAQGGVVSARDQPVRVDVAVEGDPLPLREARAIFDRAYLSLVLARCEGNVTATAKILGLSRTYVSELLTRFQLRA